MDIISQEVNSLYDKQLFPNFEDEQIRDQFNKIGLSDDTLKILSQIHSGETKEDLVYFKVFIENINDPEIFIGAQKYNNQVEIHAFGELSEQLDAVPVYFDLKSYKATILQNNAIYKPTNQTCIIRQYLNDSIQPKIFNILHVLAKKVIEDDQLILQCIKFFEVQQPELDLLANYQNLLHTINSILNDQLAAQWICLNILSTQSWEMYQDTGRQLLNLFNINVNQAEQLIQLISQINSPTLPILLDIDLLQKQQTLSKGDLENQTIQLGQLVVPSNCQSTIIVNETVLKEGKLVGPQLQNLSNIQNFINHSKVGIDYIYQIVEIPVRTSVLILSLGKTFIELSIPLKYQGTWNNQKQDQNTYNFDGFIQYIHEIQKQKKYKIGDELQKIVNETYIELRKQQDLHIQPINLHIWIQYGLLLSMVNGHLELKQQQFEQAVQLDLERIKRNLIQ